MGYNGCDEGRPFDFKPPEDRIALEPAHPRDAARLLVVRPDAAAPLDREASTRFTDSSMYRLPELLRPGDALVSTTPA